MSSQPSSQPTTGLSRTRSLRRPQAGPSALAAAGGSSGIVSAAASNGSVSSSSDLPARGVSPSRLPVKPVPGSAASTRPAATAPAAAAAAAAANGAAATAAMKARATSSSSSGGVFGRLRRPAAGAAGDAAAAKKATSGTSASSTTASKPPSASRTNLLSSVPSAPASGLVRRPTTSGGLPPAGAGIADSAAGRGRASAVQGPARAGHARTKSTSTLASATTLTATTALRPPSAQSSSAGSSSAAGSRPPTRGSTVTSNTAAAAAAPVPPKTVVSHRRQLSAAAARLEERKTHSSTAPSTTNTSAAANRPAFTTLQQHFSPAKNLAPKPRVAAILAPPASPSKAPANVALSAETARLQTTLLHLHLLHRDAAAVDAAWHASARRTLADGRFAALAADHAELVRIAGQRAEYVNAVALYRWADDDPSSSLLTLEERIQALDAVLSGVWSLAGDGSGGGGVGGGGGGGGGGGIASSTSSSYARLVRRFEHWAQRTAALVEARQRVDSLDDLDDLDSDGPSGHTGCRSGLELLSADRDDSSADALLLDAAWHDECARLMRKLEGWQQQLGTLGTANEPASEDLEAGAGAGAGPGPGERRREAAPPASSLGRILAGCSQLVDGMLAELRIMLQLERDAAEQELAWIRRMNASAGVCAGNDSHKTDNYTEKRQGVDVPARAGAIWRVM